jgi:hypothetical protein
VLPCPAHHPMPVYGPNSPLTCPSRCLFPLRCCAARAHARPATLLPQQSITSLYGPALLRVVLGLKRRPLPLHLVYARASCSSPVSHHHGASPLILPHHQCRATSPLLPPRAQVLELPQPKELTPSPPLSFGAVDHTGEPRISIARNPRCELVPCTVLGRCIDAHGSAASAPSHWLPPPMPCCALSPCTARHVDLNEVRARLALQTMPCQVMPCSAGPCP